jgi:hypothetical protein
MMRSKDLCVIIAVAAEFSERRPARTARAVGSDLRAISGIDDLSRYTVADSQSRKCLFRLTGEVNYGLLSASFVLISGLSYKTTFNNEL